MSPSPVIESHIILIVEPLGLGLGVDPELLGLLPEGVAVVPGVARHLRQLGVAGVPVGRGVTPYRPVHCPRHRARHRQS